jgi:hypothetical protein
MSEVIRQSRSRLALLTRYAGPDAPETIEAKKEHRLLSVAECIEKNLADCPPLNDEQITKLRDVFAEAVTAALTMRRGSHE